MAQEKALFAFAEEAETPKVKPSAGEWHVRVLDDEPQVHTITKLVLEDVRIDGRRLVFDHAYSGAEARTL